MHTKERLLAVGGVHALDDAAPCHLARVEPMSSLEDLGWKDTLVVRAQGEGTAELMCGGQRARLRMVIPARLDLMLVDEQAVLGQHFHVRVVVLDHAGSELEIGKWTEVVWRSDGVIAVDEDSSAGEFGLCDTCFGMQRFRASAPGTGTIEARLGAATGTLRVTVRP